MALNGPSSPFAYPEIGTEASVRAMTAADFKDFWKSNILPNNAALIVSGDISESDLKAMLEKTFGPWKSAESPAAKSETNTEVLWPRLVMFNIPGTPQTQLRVASHGPARSTPDY